MKCPLLSQGNGGHRPCSGQLPTRSQDTAKPSIQRAEGEHTRSQSPSLPSHHFLQAIPSPKMAPGQQEHHNSAWDPHMPSRSLSPKCASCCHLGSGSSWCRIVRCYMDFNILMKLSSMCKRPLREIQSPVQMLHSAWLDWWKVFLFCKVSLPCFGPC